jgi:hypothetical protein
MLTVWTVCVGTKYTDKDVQIVKHMVSRHMDAPHAFRCLSDRQIEGIDCLIPGEVWPGWWSKLLLFKYATGLNLYLDLDVVVTGSLDGLLSKTLSMPANWGQSGHGGCQSSVMSWGRSYPELFRSFDPAALDRPERGNCGAFNGLWGDQEYITQVLGSPGRHILPMEGVYSYKYHCRQSLPDDACVVCFHGTPKPSEVSDAWVVSQRSM